MRKGGGDRPKRESRWWFLCFVCERKPNTFRGKKVEERYLGRMLETVSFWDSQCTKKSDGNVVETDSKTK